LPSGWVVEVRCRDWIVDGAPTVSRPIYQFSVASGFGVADNRSFPGVDAGQRLNHADARKLQGSTGASDWSAMPGSASGLGPCPGRRFLAARSLARAALSG
jgi:hypothetical protein